DQLLVFRQVRDQIKARVIDLARTLNVSAT
ncbi:arsenate reductase (thioredoxin), partial [Streptococcus thermophilus]|nr:arsenate reductase (thioredoxin) [Streptococcus thermophilus]